MSEYAIEELTDAERDGLMAALAEDQGCPRCTKLEAELAAAKSALAAQAPQDAISGDLAASDGASGPECHRGSSSRADRLNPATETREVHDAAIEAELGKARERLR